MGSLRDRYGPAITIVHGMAPGVDTAFAVACRRLKVKDEPHPADWETLGKGAGPRRNQAMVDLGATFAIAVHRDLEKSRGTKDCVSRCHAAGIPVYHVRDLHSCERIQAPMEFRRDGTA